MRFRGHPSSALLLGGLLSVILHGLFLSILVTDLPSKPADEPTELTWLAAPPPPVPTTPSRGTGTSRPPAIKSSGDVGTNWDGHLPGIGAADLTQPEAAAKPLSGADKITAVQRVFDRIDQTLVYPQEFQDKDIAGTVRARLVFSSDGKFQRARSDVSALSRYLRVLVLMNLRHAFSEPLPANYLRGHGLVVRALYRFGSAVSTETKANQTVLGDLLSFDRAEPLEAGHFGPVTGVGALPAGPRNVPIPAVSLDPEWIVEAVRGIARNGEPVDPLEKYRKDPEW